MRNPIDWFILAKLEEAGLTSAQEADRVTLIRRVTFDLIGLPPTPAEIEAFVHDSAPDAYERLVERLLLSPHYGERWATSWLDLARFAESDGFKADDTRPLAWRYRDYVIRAFNEDKPYDRFVKEQIAGDELYPDDADALIATGFNRHYPDEYNAVNLEQRRQEILNDITDTTAQVFLGLTLGCARCHDHKYDPIAQEDYYRIQAFFAGYSPLDVPVGRHDEMQAYRRRMQEWETRTAEARRQLAALEEPYHKRFAAQRRGRFPKEYAELLDIPASKRQPLQEQLAAMVAKQVQSNTEEVVKTMKPPVRQQWQELTKLLAEQAGQRPKSPPLALALTDVGPTAPATYLLHRGDWRHKGKEVVPGFLSAFDDRPANVPPPSAGASTTGRRSALAQWLTRPENPLTARVQVNRLWQHHFGKGIVGTPSDFGNQGEPPTHPELLDWLACEFMARGWSMKAMHRLMVTSAAYRQGSTSTLFPGAGSLRDGVKVDPDNHLIWRSNRRRLEGEALRDALLAVSGQLNTKAGGSSIFPELPAELGVPRGGWPVNADPIERNRRSVYVFVKRNLRYPLFGAFDAPDSNETCARRYISTTAPQALFLLNDRLVSAWTHAFAARVLREAGPESAAVVDHAYLLALGRTPDDAERQRLLAFLNHETAEARRHPAATGAPPGVDPAYGAAVVRLCHALVNLNEFLYVD